MSKVCSNIVFYKIEDISLSHDKVFFITILATSLFTQSTLQKRLIFLNLLKMNLKH